MPGQTVGEVSIKVRPDTTQFSKELRAELKKINDDFKVDVGLQTKKAEAEFKALKTAIEKDSINANLKLNTKALGAAAGFRKPLQGIATAFQGIERSLDRAAASVNKLTRNLVAVRQVVGDTVYQSLAWALHLADVATRVETLRKAWNGLTTAFRAMNTKAQYLAILAREMSIAGGEALKLAGIRFTNMVKGLKDASLYTGLAHRAMASLRSATDRVAVGLYRIRNIRLKDVANGFRMVVSSAKTAARGVVSASGAIARGIGSMMDSGIKGVGKLISKSLSGIGDMVSNVGNAFGNMSRGMLIFVAIAAVAAPLIGLIAGLIAGLPSLLLAAGAAFAAIALGMDGIKNAAKTLQPQVDALKKALSDRWESGLTPIMNQLKGVFPVIQEGLLQVTDGLLSMARGVTNVITSVQGMEALKTILAGVGQFFTGITPMVSNMTSAFLQLGAAGAKNFGFLIDVLNKFGASFADMTARITGSTAFADAMRGMAQVLDALLQGFVKLTEAGVVAMGQLGGPMASLINGLVNAFVAFMPILTAISNMLFNVLGAAFQALVPVFQALTPAITLIANTLGTILTGAINALVPVLTPLAQLIGQVLLAAFQAIQPILPVLVNLFMQLGTMLGGVLSQALVALTPLISLMAQTFAQIVTLAMPLLPLFGELAMALIPPLISAVLQLAPLLMDLAKTVFPILVEIIRQAVPVIQQIVAAFVTILPPVIAFISYLIGQAMPVIQGLLSIIRSVFPQIQGIITGVMNVIKGIINVVLGIIQGDWRRAWDGLKQILKGAWDAIISAIKGAIGIVLGIVRGIGPSILSAVGNFGSLLYNSGRALLIGLWNGIASMMNWILDKVKGFVQGIRNFFPFSPAKTGPFSGKGYTTHSGRALIKDFAKGMADEAPRAIRTVEDMMGQLNRTASTSFTGKIESDGFGDITGELSTAMSGLEFNIDERGGRVIAKIVRRENNVQNVRAINGRS